MSKRIKNEFCEIAKKRPPGIAVWQDDPDDVFVWRVLMAGPTNSPYAGGVFEITLRFPKNYPFAPLDLTFLTPICHPYVDPSGSKLCCCFAGSILGESWSPALSSYIVLTALRESLQDPADDGGCSHSMFWFNDTLGATAMARSMTEAHAMSSFLRALAQRDLLWLAPELARRSVGARAIREMDAQTLSVLHDGVSHGLAMPQVRFSPLAILDTAVPMLASLATVGCELALRDLLRISPLRVRQSAVTMVSALRTRQLPRHVICVVIVFCVSS